MIRGIKILFLFSFSFFQLVVYAQPGAIDQWFNPMDAGYNNGSGSNGLIMSFVQQNDGKIVVGGYYSMLRGRTQNYLARLNLSGTFDESFVIGTGPNNIVECVILQPDGKIVLGGSFTTFNGSQANRIIRLNTDGSPDTGFNTAAGFNGIVTDIALQSDGKLVVVGSFTMYNGVSQSRIARLNSDGSIDNSFNVGSGANSSIENAEIQQDGKIVIIGGFATFNGITKNKVARINTDGSLDASFDTGNAPNGSIGSLLIQQDGKILIGGAFSVFSGALANELVRLNPNGEIDNTFDSDSNLNGVIYNLELLPNNQILVAGWLNPINGIPNLVRLNTDGSADTSFLPPITNNPVTAIATQADGKLLIGGEFGFVDGIPQSKIARLEADLSLDLSFAGTGLDNDVYAIESSNDGGYFVGGAFYLYNSERSRGVVKIQADGSIDNYFNPQNIVAGSIQTIKTQSNGSVLIGGDFISGNALGSDHLTLLNSDGSVNPNFSALIEPSGFSHVSTICQLSDTSLIIGGSFQSFNGVTVGNIVKLDANGDVINDFQTGTGANASISTISLQSDGKIIVCGDFTSFNGQSFNRIVRLNEDGSIDYSFDPGSGTNFIIHKSCVLPDGRILIVGDFTTFNGITRNRIARLNTDGSLDLTFDPLGGADNQIFDLVIDNDNKILICGSFTSYQGFVNGHIARLHEDGLFDQTFQVGSGAGSTVKRVLLSNNGLKYLIGGYFTEYNGVGRNRLARVLNCIPTYSNIYDTACYSYTFNGETYNSSGNYTQVLTNSAGCDSIVTLQLTINESISSQNIVSCTPFVWSQNGYTYMTSGVYYDTVFNQNTCDSIYILYLEINSNSQMLNASSCDSYTLNSQTYTTTGAYTQTLTNVAGCDSILTLNLTIIPSIPQQTNTFSLPSDPNNCLGQLAIQTTGNPDFTADIDGGTPFTYSGYHLEQNLCSGVHSLSVTDACGNTLPSTFVIPVDTNYVFNNPFIDSIAVDSLGQTIENCDIYYNSIDTAFIDSLWANGNTVNVIWNIVDSNGSNLDTSTYVLNNGNGVYWLQLSVFCPVRALGDYFTVTEAIYFEDGNVTMAGLDDPELFEVSIFPNPSNGIVTVTAEVSGAALSVMDTQGKTIVSNQSFAGQTQIDLSFVQSGVYFFRVETENGSVVKRVVKH